MIRQPEPKADVLARRDEIVAGLSALLPAEGQPEWLSAARAAL